MACARQAVELRRDAVTILMGDVVYADALREVLPDQPVRVLVGAAFPPVVRRRGLALRPHEALLPIDVLLKPRVQLRRCPSRQEPHRRESGLALDERHNARPRLRVPEHGVDCPVIAA